MAAPTGAVAVVNTTTTYIAVAADDQNPSLQRLVCGLQVIKKRKCMCMLWIAAADSI